MSEQTTHERTPRYAGYVSVCARCDPNRAYPPWDTEHGARARHCEGCGEQMAILYVPAADPQETQT